MKSKGVEICLAPFLFFVIYLNPSPPPGRNETIITYKGCSLTYNADTEEVLIWVKVVMYMMWRFKSCPRCKGDMFIDRDMDGWYQQCLQCSYRYELKELAKFKEQPVMTGEKRAKK